MATTGICQGEALGLEWSDLTGNTVPVLRAVTADGPEVTSVGEADRVGKGNDATVGVVEGSSDGRQIALGCRVAGHRRSIHP
jgi:hypothetical protein